MRLSDHSRFTRIFKRKCISVSLAKPDKDGHIYQYLIPYIGFGYTEDCDVDGVVNGCGLERALEAAGVALKHVRSVFV